ncbi:DALR anticodon-binding domain-containing protein 3 [Zerene cesonia]|uniref:DALR anticodon-binding domain-containing protein 3 n=1 Tax=Zerene cesonia TaxID=33412 RepID=UPI0018E4E8F7|nr:DALR anticodon-binding domain-containing protein 3 [Zerene cesonia]
MMLEDELNLFISNIYSFLFNVEKEISGLLVKKHSVQLQTQGDFSFPNKVKSWVEFLDDIHLQNDDEGLLKCLQKDSETLLQASQSWTLPIRKVTEIKDHLHIFLDRHRAIEVGLSSSLTNNERILVGLNEGNCLVESDSIENTTCITSLRMNYTAEVIKNLYSIYDKRLEFKPKLLVTSKSSVKLDDSKIILCGTVLNCKTGSKETTITADDFIRLRQDELTLIAQHKYGVRVSTDSKWKEFIRHLGESAVAFELLQIKPSSPVKIQFDASSGSSKGAAFILYNCARLETIIKTFNEHVNDGRYPTLPKFEDIDFSLLTNEDEWCLIFNYILGFPSLLRNCVEINESKCDFRPHLLCSFLSSMVRVFSQYYRKVRILTEARKHLLPVMFARIYMLKSLNDTLKTCLRLLNIKSVSQMYWYFLL